MGIALVGVFLVAQAAAVAAADTADTATANIANTGAVPRGTCPFTRLGGGSGGGGQLNAVSRLGLPPLQRVRWVMAKQCPATWPAGAHRPVDSSCGFLKARLGATVLLGESEGRLTDWEYPLVVQNERDIRRVLIMAEGADEPTLVLFHASSCVFSQALKPVFVQVAHSFPQMCTLSVELIYGMYGRSVLDLADGTPSVVFYSGGEFKNKYRGDRSLEDLTSWVQHVSNLSAFYEPDASRPLYILDQTVRLDSVMLTALWLTIVAVLYILFTTWSATAVPAEPTAIVDSDVEESD